VSLPLRALTLPAEHGGWSFVLEPIVLGLLVSPSRPGVALALAAMATFLARHPLRLAAGDRVKGRQTARTGQAVAVAAFYGLLAALAFGFAWTDAARPAFWVPLLAATPLLGTQFACDVRNRGRNLTPELLGAAAPGSLASAITIVGGGAVGTALVLWPLLALRGVASVLYVRARLRRDRGQPYDARSTWTSHLSALLLAAAFASTGHAPFSAVAAFAGLLARAAFGLTRTRPLKPQVLGLRELAYGLGTAVVIGLGYVRIP
jgi:hypothetical protein